jgi:hypothetical protein
MDRLHRDVDKVVDKFVDDPLAGLFAIDVPWTRRPEETPGRHKRDRPRGLRTSSMGRVVSSHHGLV